MRQSRAELPEPKVGASARRPTGLVGRAALLEALQLESLDWFELPDAQSDGRAMAGYQRQTARVGATSLPADADGSVKEPGPPVAQDRRLPLRMPLAWVVTSQRTVDADSGEDGVEPDQASPQSDEPERVALSCQRPDRAEADRAISDLKQQAARQTWARLRQPLREALDPAANVPWRQPVDWGRAVARVARGESLWPLPRRSRPRWPGGLTLLLDGLAPSVTPLRGEMDAIAASLRRSIGGHSAVPVYEFGERGPRSPLHGWQRDTAARRTPGPAVAGMDRPDWRRWHGQVVLLVSDLGAHERDAGRREDWGALVREALQAGVQVQALVPAAAPGLAGLPRAMRWSAWADLGRPQSALPYPTAGQKHEPPARQGASAHSSEPVTLARLLALLGLCGSAHSLLLQALVRLVAPGRQEGAWLWRLWNHADVERLRGGMARLRPEREQPHLMLLKHVPADLLWQVHRLRRTFCAGAPEADEHAAVLRALALAPQLAVPLQAEAAVARRFVEHDWWSALQSAEGAERARKAAGAVIWVACALPAVRLSHRRALRRMLDWAHEPALRRGERVAFHPELGPPGVPQQEGAEASSSHWSLVQQGRVLLLRDAQAGDGAGLRLADIGPVSRTEGVTVVAGASAQWLPLEDPEVPVSTWDGRSASLRLLFGRHEVTLKTLPRPRGVTGWSANRSLRVDLPWGGQEVLPLNPAPSKVARTVSGGHTCGVDEVGAFLDVMVTVVPQRFRYIQPGSFWMGSPPSEVDRDDDEGPRHRVTLTQGYWLADTPCTQGLWEAVMGDNPSSFKEGADARERPVDSVSWYMVQNFLKALNSRLPPGCEAVLPTEAQWEHAARAGSESAYWWGDKPVGERANWGGEQGRTTAVKVYPANPWGLYDVHGNVWEWCAGSMRTYEAGEAIDPPDGQDKDWRALRGGSWNLPPGNARSASRLQSRRDDDWRLIGFRLALRSTSPGQEGGGAAGRPEGEESGGRGAAEPPPGRRAGGDARPGSARKKVKR